jgi:hypothetical protein
MQLVEKLTQHPLVLFCGFVESIDRNRMDNIHTLNHNLEIFLKKCFQDIFCQIKMYSFLGIADASSTSRTPGMDRSQNAWK